jgi:hypothetical protein
VQQQFALARAEVEGSRKWCALTVHGNRTLTALEGARERGDTPMLAQRGGNVVGNLKRENPLRDQIGTMNAREALRHDHRYAELDHNERGTFA